MSQGQIQPHLVNYDRVHIPADRSWQGPVVMRLYSLFLLLLVAADHTPLATAGKATKARSARCIITSNKNSACLCRHPHICCCCSFWQLLSHLQQQWSTMLFDVLVNASFDVHSATLVGSALAAILQLL